MRRLQAWWPPVAWMGLILWLGSDSGSAEHTGRVILPILRSLFPGASPLELEAMHGLVRKLGHLTEYAVLAALWTRALLARGSRPGRAACGASAIAVAWALIDETWQVTVSSRTGSPADVALDAAGALLVAIPVGLGWRRAVVTMTGIALWVAAVGGATLLLLNLATGVPSGVLWLTVPVAALALWLGRRATP